MSVLSMIAEKDTYITDPKRRRSIFSKIFLSPKFMFYPQVFCIVWLNGRRALRGVYGGAEWASSSLDIMRALENVGVRLGITGMENIRKPEGPVVFISNHMSAL
ncbi:MAG: 1-acyl-sn-glycerol-3-phosphate acyltransferase, partial [Nitrospirae bacterium]|nr:1-acyl-sn-glycerol-3-phosphate acyltransferase [Nitrospirota bacterium]